MTTYDQLLKKVRTKAAAFRSSTAREYVRPMYDALRNEEPNLSPADARARNELDCVDIWDKRTILKFLPDEAKDLIKQKSGRSGQKKRKSAAAAAAKCIEKEIMIDTEGRPVDNFLPPSPTFESTTEHVLSQSHERDHPKYDDKYVQLELCINRALVQSFLFLLIANQSREDTIRFNLILDKRTFQVISFGIADQDELFRLSQG